MCSACDNPPQINAVPASSKVPGEEDVPFFLQHAGVYGDRPGCKDWCEGKDETDCKLASAYCVVVTSVDDAGGQHIGENKAHFERCATRAQQARTGNDCNADMNGIVTDGGRQRADLYYKQISLPFEPPQTLDDWLARFGFPKARTPNENPRAYFDQHGYLAYRNNIELGLGRLLGCREFVDDVRDGRKLMGQACFVTNYGERFYDPVQQMEDVLADQHVRNTVCITYRPSQPPGSQVQFWAYDGNGKLLKDAQLDPRGARPIPAVCTECHGGHYVAADECLDDSACGDVVGACVGMPVPTGSGNVETVNKRCSNRYTAIGARFLPINPYSISFADEILGRSAVTPSQTRAGQMGRMRAVTEAAFKTPLTEMQTSYIKKLWNLREEEQFRFTHEKVVPPPQQPRDTSPGAGVVVAAHKEKCTDVVDRESSVTACDDKMPSHYWNVDADRRDLWNKVVLPYCGTCHMAIKPRPISPGGVCGGDCTSITGETVQQFAIDTYFNMTQAGFRGSLCGTSANKRNRFHMPHAMPTQRLFWLEDSQHPVVIGSDGKALSPTDHFFRSPRAALLQTLKRLENSGEQCAIASRKSRNCKAGQICINKNCVPDYADCPIPP
jgi:hypothetical protein